MSDIEMLFEYRAEHTYERIYMKQERQLKAQRNSFQKSIDLFLNLASNNP